MNNEDLTKLKQIELDILKEFMRICDRLHLRYFAIGGTLLGAVRHRGFIPWDDDIDIGMPRQDYAVFVQKAPSLLPPPYFLQTHQTDPEYPLNFAKIRNSDTTFIESSLADRRINHGVYIDIFPFDYYPDQFFKQCWFDIRWKLFHFRMRSEFIIPNEYKASLGKRFLQQVAMAVAKLIYPSAEKAIQEEATFMQSVKSGKLLGNLYGVVGKREVVPADYFENTQRLPFEDLLIPVPVEYHAYLTHIYGDYMTPPPADQQVPHHYNDKIDLYNSYTKYGPGNGSKK